MPDLHGLKVLRPGLELGVLKKGRFEPAHALALWLRDCGQRADYPADAPEILAYLQGQVLPGPQSRLDTYYRRRPEFRVGKGAPAAN